MKDGKRALVVDDEHLILKIISDILTKENYEVKTSLNCDKALEFLREHNFHVVLADIRMPERSGIDLIERIRLFNPDLPVIFMTGFASLETAVSALQHGAFDYLTKPLDYAKLSSVVKNAVRSYELVQENKRLVNELRELNESLELKVRERNRDLENILNSTHESILTTDRHLAIMSANPKTADLFGGNLVGRRLNEVVGSLSFSSIIPRALTDSRYVSKHELKYRDKFLEIHLSPLVDFETAGIFGIVAVTQDVTDKKKLEADIVQSAKMSAVGELAAGVAHEFNNILMGISGYTSFAMSRTSIEQIKSDLKVVEKASDRAAEIVRKLLSFSRQREDEFQLAAIEEVIEDAFALIEHTFQSGGIRIVRRYAEISPIKMNAGEIQQVFLNMAINSKHAMPPEGGVIEVAVEPEGDCVKIVFSDDGIGIPEENLSKIFEPFFTTRRTGGSNFNPGTGLGLSVAYAIIQRHGGRINASSEIGKGTMFTIRLPNVQLLSDAPESDSGEEVRDDIYVEARRAGNILVVDDEEIVCDIIRESILENGRDCHNVVISNSGETAVELISELHFDVVFLDSALLYRNGFNLLRNIKALDPDSEIVIISGRSEEGMSDRLMSEGVFSLIYKPFTPIQIQNTVARILEAK